mgnify:CR=1 FL=1
MNRCVILLIGVAVWCGPACTRRSKPDTPTQNPGAAYKPAQADYGKLRAAWNHPSIPDAVPSAGHKLVAADIELPPPEGKFDLDDIDIFDADSGENFGSDPLIYGLSDDGRWIDTDDPDYKDRLEYRAVFIWGVPNHVTRVNFGYWGDMLFVKPVVLQASGPVAPSSHVKVISWRRMHPSGGYNPYVVLLRTHNWFRRMAPNSYTLLASGAPEDRDLCDCDRWVELDARGAPRTDSVTSRAYLEAERRFVVEFWCPQGSIPDQLNLYGSQTPLGKTDNLVMSKEIETALGNAVPEINALHRLN